ncbi:hypothetical protein [Flavobacterium sp.]|uniref:hypothetical protein n=1 Tax=Flavobacterium sp. TaxID=239 RepID=UPI0012298970|nr:hypothetical protein [Flavobacterium sp.]RZJ72866.1 MAG: hypothetical protein EOO49_04325 [Flavobacterium sp.]
MQDFVTNVNKSSSTMSNAVFRSISAEVKPGKTITFVSELEATNEEADVATFSKLGPPIIAEMVNQLPGGKDLMDEGVKFHVIFKTRDGVTISDETLDKAAIAKLTNVESSKNFGDNSGKPSVGSKANIASGLKNMLQVLNRNLPIVVDKETDMKITRIDVNEKNELVYSVEIPKDLTANFDNPAIKEILKQELLKDGNIRRIFPGIAQHGIETITYEYGAKGEKPTLSVSIHKDEIK